MVHGFAAIVAAHQVLRVVFAGPHSATGGGGVTGDLADDLPSGGPPVTGPSHAVSLAEGLHGPPSLLLCCGCCSRCFISASSRWAGASPARCRAQSSTSRNTCQYCRSYASTIWKVHSPSMT